jgi:ATP-dependent RNA helicase DHX29
MFSVILMSATADAQHFSDFFTKKLDLIVPKIVVPGETFPVMVNFIEDIVELTGYVLEPNSEYSTKTARLVQDGGKVSISGKGGKSYTMHLRWEEQVYKQNFVSDELSDEEDPLGNESNNNESIGSYSVETLNIVERMDPRKINYDLIVQLIYYIHQHEPAGPDGGSGSILVFLPGYAEISILERLLLEEVSTRPNGKNQPPKWLILPLHSSIPSSGILYL